MATEIDTTRQIVRSSTSSHEEIADGYIFTFTDLTIFPQIADFVKHERQCCTFLDFHLENTDKTITCTVTLNNSNLDLDNVKEVILALFSND